MFDLVSFQHEYLHFQQCLWKKHVSLSTMIINSRGRKGPILGDGIMLRAESSIVSHTFKYRDRIAIIGDILKTVKNSREGRKKTQIMQSANLNYVQTKKYINYLIDCGFLVVTQREMYVITKEGTRFLQLVEVQRIHSLR